MKIPNFKQVQQIKTSAHLCNLIYLYFKDETAAVSKINQLLGSVKIRAFNLENCDVQALVVTKNNETYLIFEGTKSLIDTIADLAMDLRPDANGQGHFHTGFMKVTEWCYKQISEQLKAIALNNPSMEFIVSGHSLGGAMAMLMTKLLKNENSNFPIELLVTYGQPRCGNSKFTKHFDLNEVPYFRFINYGDHVSDVPVPFLKSDWSHGGSGYLCKDGKISLYTAEYEKGLMTRIISVIVAFFQLYFAKKLKTNFSMLSKNHDMDLYLDNISIGIDSFYQSNNQKKRKSNENIFHEIEGPNA